MAHLFPQRFLVFSLVGISGIAVNTAILWLGTEAAGLPYQLASLFAIQIAILNNFIWNLKFTWRDRNISGFKPVRRALGQFILISWIAGGVNWLILILLTELAGWHYLLANLLAILLASLVNYFANDLWTFTSAAGQGKSNGTETGE